MPDKVATIWAKLDKKGKIIEVSSNIGDKKYRKLKIRYHVPNKKGMGRAKGNSLERETAKAFSLWIYNKPKYLKRTPLSGGWASSKAGDIILDHEIAERKKIFHPPIYVECRSYKDLLGHDVLTWTCTGKPQTLSKWIHEVESKCRKKLPILVLKGNKTKPWVMLMKRWLSKKTWTTVSLFSPIRLCKNNHLIYLIPLSWLERLGEGKDFLTQWREDGGSAYLKRYRKRIK